MKALTILWSAYLLAGSSVVGQVLTAPSRASQLEVMVVKDVFLDLERGGTFMLWLPVWPLTTFREHSVSKMVIRHKLAGKQSRYATTVVMFDQYGLPTTIENSPGNTMDFVFARDSTHRVTSVERRLNGVVTGGMSVEYGPSSPSADGVYCKVRQHGATRTHWVRSGKWSFCGNDSVVFSTNGLSLSYVIGRGVTSRWVWKYWLGMPCLGLTMGHYLESASVVDTVGRMILYFELRENIVIGDEPTLYEGLLFLYENTRQRLPELVERLPFISFDARGDLRRHTAEATDNLIHITYTATGLPSSKVSGRDSVYYEYEYWK